MKGWWCHLIAACGLVATTVAGQMPSPTNEAPAWPEAITLERVEDAEVARVLDDLRLATSPSRPTFSGYQADLVAAFVGWFSALLSRILPEGGQVTRWLTRFGLPMLAALVVLVVGIALVQLLRRGSRRPAIPGAATARRLPTPEAATATDWEQALQERLAEGEVTGALEALWWWLADRLTPGRADPAWTSRELLERAGRRDLRPQVQHLDRLIYGAAPVAVETVRGVWRDLREAV